MRAIISFLFIFLCGFSAFNSTKINFYGVNIEEKKMDDLYFQSDLVDFFLMIVLGRWRFLSLIIISEYQIL